MVLKKNNWLLTGIPARGFGYLVKIDKEIYTLSLLSSSIFKNWAVIYIFPLNVCIRPYLNVSKLRHSRETLLG